MTRQAKKKTVSARASGLGQVLLLSAPDRKNGAKGRQTAAPSAVPSTVNGEKHRLTNGRRAAGTANGELSSVSTNLQVIGVKETNGHAINGNHAGNGKTVEKIGVAVQVGLANGHGKDNIKANGNCAANRNSAAVLLPLTSAGSTPSTAEKISRPVAQDRELVDRCLAKDVGAWSQMYARFHGSLIASVRAFLGQAGRDAHLVEEIAARVWYALVRDDFWLLARFDVRRGCRLSTFLSLIAKAQARLLLRSERRRKSRELAVAREEVEPPHNAGLFSLTGEEFIATLSPAEKRFLVDVLVATSDRDARERYTSQNLWQLRRRVREKLIKFLE